MGCPARMEDRLFMFPRCDVIGRESRDTSSRGERRRIFIILDSEQQREITAMNVARLLDDVL